MAAMLDQWNMSKYLTDIPKDQNITALHKKFITEGVKTFYKTIIEVPSQSVLTAINSFMQKK